MNYSIEEILNLTEDDITSSYIIELFGEFNGKNRYKPNDILEVPIGTYGIEGNKNTNKFITTIGKWLFNKLMIEKELFNVFKYVNDSITKKQFDRMNKTISYAVMEDKCSMEAMKHFLLKTQVIMSTVSALSPSYTIDMLTSVAKITEKKNELLKKYAKEIEENNEIVANAIEKELLDYAKKEIGEDEAMDLYNSGASGSFDNNFKNMFVMRGAVPNNDPSKGGFTIVTSNFMEGIKKEEYATMADSLAAGPVARAVKTQLGGYDEKLFGSAFQHVIADPEGSDCETKKHVKVYLDDSNIDEWMYSYIIEGSKLVELTSDVKDKYIGKTVKFRFSSMCESKTGICNKCLGNLFYRLGIKNIGMATPKIPSVLKQKSMKLFHNSQLKLHTIDVNKAFGFEE